MIKLFICILIALGAGIIDIVPMVIRRMNGKTILSAFVHYFVVALVILNIDIPFIPGILEGPIVSLGLALPIMILVSQNDKKAVPPMASMAVILGTLISLAGMMLL